LTGKLGDAAYADAAPNSQSARFLQKLRGFHLHTPSVPPFTLLVLYYSRFEMSMFAGLR